LIIQLHNQKTHNWHAGIQILRLTAEHQKDKGRSEYATHAESKLLTTILSH